MSNGLLDTVGEAISSRLRLMVNPAEAPTGVRDRTGGGAATSRTFDAPLPSPRRTRVSMDFSRLPLKPLSTAVFLFSSLNPISRNFANFISSSSIPSAPTGVPNTRDGLFRGGGDGVRCCS